LSLEEEEKTKENFFDKNLLSGVLLVC